MSINIHPYEILAMMMRYPADSYRKTFLHDTPSLTKQFPEEAKHLQNFIKHIEDSTTEELQELYTRTFDVQAICFLDIGYVLFGEDYKRGMFLVHMKREQAKAENDCGTEMPDHLPNVLGLLTKLKDKELAQEFTVTFFIPALEKMLTGFKEKGNVYSGPLKTILAIMKKDYSCQSQGLAGQGVAL